MFLVKISNWNGRTHSLHYLRGTEDLGLLYQSKQDTTLIGFTYVEYLSDPHKAKSQNGYVFIYGHYKKLIKWRPANPTPFER